MSRANYRKYGVISFTKAEDSKKPLDKLEPKSKKQKVGLVSTSVSRVYRLNCSCFRLGILVHP
jgi:hypothetical protein